MPKPKPILAEKIPYELSYTEDDRFIYYAQQVTGELTFKTAKSLLLWMIYANNSWVGYNATWEDLEAVATFGDYDQLVYNTLLRLEENNLHEGSMKIVVDYLTLQIIEISKVLAQFHFFSDQNRKIVRALTAYRTLYQKFTGKELHIVAYETDGTEA